MEYRGYIIEPTLSYSKGYDYFLKENGRDDCTKRALTIREAKDCIDERLAEEPVYEVETKGWMGRTITKFHSISEAVMFAVKANGRPLFQISNM